MDLSNPYLGPLYALIAGIFTSASPCALAAVPLVIGHMAGAAPGAGKRARARDIFSFLLGMTMALTLVGVFAGALGKSLVLTAPWVRWGAGFAFIGGGASYLGLFGGSKTCSVPLALAGDTKEHAVEANDESRWTAARRCLSGISMGALYGLSASPCATPTLLAILSLVASTGSLSKGAVLLLAYSVGQSLLVALAGLATSQFQAALVSRRGMRAIEILRRLGGAAIMGFGVYLLLRPYI